MKELKEGEEEIIVVKLKDIKLDKEYQAKHRRMTGLRFEALKESIRERGLKELMLVNQNLVLLDGYNRYYAIKELGWKEVKVLRKYFKDRNEEREAIEDRNRQRRQESKFGLIYAEIDDYLKAHGLTIKDLKKSEKFFNKEWFKKMGKFTHIPKRFSELIARKVGVGEKTVRMVKTILEHNPSEEVIKALQEGVFSINEIYKMYRAFEDVPDKVKKKLEKKFLKGEYSSEEVIKAITTTKAIKEQLETEDDDVKEKAEKVLKKKFWTKELDLKEAIWEIEEVAGDSHSQFMVRREFPIDKFKDFNEAQAWARARGGTCLGKIEKWYIEYDSIEDKKLKEKEKKKA